MLDCQFIVPDDGANDMRFVFQDANGDVAGNIRAAWKANRGNASDEDGGQNQTAAANGVTIFGAARGNNNQGMNMTIKLWQPISSDGDIHMQWTASGMQSGYFLFVTSPNVSTLKSVRSSNSLIANGSKSIPRCIASLT